MKPRLVTDLPDPPTITPEVLERILREAREFRAEMRRRIDACERLTAEDWSTVVR